MELPSRPKGDELLPDGEMSRIRHRLRTVAQRHDLATVIAYAFDFRTRMLPFIYPDLRMPPGGVLALGCAMVDSGFSKTRIVLQQWNRSFRPSQMRVDGRIPDLFMVSSLQIHSERAHALIRDAGRIDPKHRPLIIVGGPMAFYEPWEFFSSHPHDGLETDVVVTGEEYVLLSLLEAVCSIRSRHESMRSAFVRARDSGALDEIPGLVYARTDARGTAEELVDTGIQRLVGNLDELPHSALGYDLLEPPSVKQTLNPNALPPREVRRHCRISSILLTHGCKFRCSYCPIPAYNQRKFRAKSGERISDEIEQIYRRFGIRFFFGADDNFFNDKRRALEITETLARKVDAGSRPHSKIRWGTEATIHDTLQLKEHLPTIRRAGLWALWLGVEDMTATFVKKGQDKDKTTEAFHLLRESGIFPVPMLMHHESQPLYTLKSDYGLLNQIKKLRKAGAVFAQVLFLAPAMGAVDYEEMHTSGLVYKRVNGIAVEKRHIDGNYIVALRSDRPWIKQLNMFWAYLYFFNPLRFLGALIRPKTQIPLADAETSPSYSEQSPHNRWRKFRRRISRTLRSRLADAFVQMFGMWALGHTARRILPWCWHLGRGRIERHTQAPASPIPMRSADGGAASHALPRTPSSEASNSPLPVRAARILSQAPPPSP